MSDFHAHRRTVHEFFSNGNNVSGVKSSVAVEKLKNLMLQAAAEIKTAAVRSLAADRLITSIKKATAENLIKAGFNPAQPRAPRGVSDGGQWTGTGGGSGGSSRQPRSIPRPRAPVKNPRVTLPDRKPMSRDELARFNRNAPSGLPPKDLEIHPDFGLPRWYVEGAVRDTASPLDVIGGSAKPLSNAIAREVRVTSALRALRNEREGLGSLTSHGRKRFRQRTASDEAIDEAVASAIRKGNTTTKRGGRRNQWQTHYRGSNGLTVIIAEEGRHKGRVITLYGKKPRGKF